MEAIRNLFIHSLATIIQICAMIFYIIASRRFYYFQKNAILHLIIALSPDIFVAATSSFGILPRLCADMGVPWHSPLFISHITLSCLGMFGFLFIFLYLLLKGPRLPFIKLRSFQYHIVLPIWCIGVGVAIANFFIKAIFATRLYDLI